MIDLAAAMPEVCVPACSWTSPADHRLGALADPTPSPAPGGPPQPPPLPPSQTLRPPLSEPAASHWSIDRTCRAPAVRSAGRQRPIAGHQAVGIVRHPFFCLPLIGIRVARPRPEHL